MFYLNSGLPDSGLWILDTGLWIGGFERKIVVFTVHEFQITRHQNLVLPAPSTQYPVPST
jgi:hypothetical protein